MKTQPTTSPLSSATAAAGLGKATGGWLDSGWLVVPMTASRRHGGLGWLDRHRDIHDRPETRLDGRPVAEVLLSHPCRA